MENGEFLKLCKKIVKEYTNEHLDKSDNVQISEDSVFIV